MLPCRKSRAAGAELLDLYLSWQILAATHDDD